MITDADKQLLIQLGKCIEAAETMETVDIYIAMMIDLLKLYYHMKQL